MTIFFDGADAQLAGLTKTVIRRATDPAPVTRRLPAAPGKKGPSCEFP